MNEPVLDIKNLSVVFHTEDGNICALRDLSLSVQQGEILAVCGESGCGKSVLCRTIMGLLPRRAEVTGGSLRVCGKDVAGLSDKEFRQVRGRDISMVFQDPFLSLDPSCRIGAQIVEAIRIRRPEISREEARQRSIKLMEAVGIDRAGERCDAYPWMLSGGMRQRCVLAMALAQEPKLLIADEPTTALDVTVQAEILDLLLKLRDERNLSVLFISHDLGVISRVADRVNIMYAGRIIEAGTCEEVLTNPAHPYTRGLLRALPAFAENGKLRPIPGGPPVVPEGFEGDAFAARNDYALGIDYLQAPPFFEITKTHRAASWLLDPRAPEVSSAETAAGRTQISSVRTADVSEQPEMSSGETPAASARPEVSPDQPALLQVRDLSCSFRLGKRNRVQACDGISFDIRRGEIFALVGESGSGKTTLARCILGMLSPQSGTILYDGIDITDRRRARSVKGRLTSEIQFISQDPGAALDPSMTVRDIIAEPLQIHRVFDRHRDLDAYIRGMLREVQLDEYLMDRTPAELSGGQKQRLSIARAYSMDPKLLVADEPLASLDVSIQAQMIDLFLSLREKHGTALLFISHDLAMVRLIAGRTGVMQGGRLVECAATDALFSDPQDPYTKKLLSVIPAPDPGQSKAGPRKVRQNKEEAENERQVIV